MRSTARNCLLVIACALASAIGWAQGRNVGFDWPATGADAQRTGWLRLDPNISVENFSKPGFEFLWREKLDNAPRQSASLSQGVTMNGLIGFTPASFVTGASNNVFAIDNDTGYPVWHRKLDAPLPAPTAQCPGGVTGAAGRVVSLVREPLQLPAPAAPGRGYRGGIGAPGEGVPMEIARRDGGAALAWRVAHPGGARRWRRCVRGPIRRTYLRCVEQRNPARPRSGLGSGSRAAGAVPSTERTLLGSDGDREHVVHEHQQRMRRRCERRLGDHAGSEEQDRELVEDERRQPGRQSRVHAKRQDSRGHRSRQDHCRWIRQCHRRARREDIAADRLVHEPVCRVRHDTGRHQSRRPRDRRRRDARRHFPSRRCVARRRQSLDASLRLADATNFEPDALATFEQPAGTPWLLVPGPRGIVAFRIVDEGGKTSLQRGWTSRDLAAPTAPIVVNDVVFAASSGRPQGSAVLYAFDSRSGRELWNSGKTMTSYVPPGNLWASNSQVHVGTYDGTVYAFGYALERR